MKTSSFGRRYNGLRNGKPNDFIAVVCTGIMDDGTKVYTEYDFNTDKLVNANIQYYRKYDGLQKFFEM